MRRNIEEFEQRIKEEADIIIAGKLTVREAAKKRNCSKSTIYHHMVEKLPSIDIIRYFQVRHVLAFNKAERHIRGGMATRKKYLERVR